MVEIACSETGPVLVAIPGKTWEEATAAIAYMLSQQLTGREAGVAAE